MSDAEFSFEHSFELDEDTYVEIYGMSRRYRPARLAMIAATGFALLFWPYTLILGLIVLGLVAFAGPAEGPRHVREGLS